MKIEPLDLTIRDLISGYSDDGDETMFWTSVHRINKKAWSNDGTSICHRYLTDHPIFCSTAT